MLTVASFKWTCVMGQHLVPPKVAQFFHRDSCIDDGGVSPLCKVFSNPKILSGVWALWWPIHVWKQPLVLHEVTILVALCLSTGSANLRHPRTARLSAESICCWQRQCRNDVILYYVGYSCLCCCWSISKPRRKAKLLDKQLKWNQVFKKTKVFAASAFHAVLFIFDDSFFTLLPFSSISCSTRQPISIRWAHRLSKTNNMQLGFWKKS